jgi:hypothetical protein
MEELTGVEAAVAAIINEGADCLQIVMLNESEAAVAEAQKKFLLIVAKALPGFDQAAVDGFLSEMIQGQDHEQRRDLTAKVVVANLDKVPQ